MIEIIQIYLDLMLTASRGFVGLVIHPPLYRLIRHLIYVLCSLTVLKLLL